MRLLVEKGGHYHIYVPNRRHSNRNFAKKVKYGGRAHFLLMLKEKRGGSQSQGMLQNMMRKLWIR